MAEQDGAAANPDRFELSPGVFVYRQAAHYLCRPCFEAGTRVVLRREESVTAIDYVCPRCNTRFPERKKPLTGLAMSPWG